MGGKSWNQTLASISLSQTHRNMSNTALNTGNPKNELAVDCFSLLFLAVLPFFDVSNVWLRWRNAVYLLCIPVGLQTIIIWSGTKQSNQYVHVPFVCDHTTGWKMIRLCIGILHACPQTPSSAHRHIIMHISLSVTLCDRGSHGAQTQPPSAAERTEYPSDPQRSWSIRLLTWYVAT